MSKTEIRTYNLVLQYIKEKIKNNELTLGNKLPSERTIMEELDLSRNSVREALRQLENMGFIQSNHGQGNFLVNQAGQGFSEIFSMLLLMNQTDRSEFLILRRSLEIEAYKQAMINRNEEDLQILQQAVEQMNHATNQDKIEEAEKIFHHTLMTAGQNKLFAMIMQALSTLEDTYRHETLSLLEDDRKRLLLQVHQDIVEALQVRDMQRGCQAMQRHFDLIV